MATASELEAIVAGIRERVRARYPEGEGLPDLLPILHARDAAEAKVAAIGSVNPRPKGPLDALIQALKRTFSRSFGWFVRDQVDYNRAVLASVDAILEALNQVNRSLSTAAGTAETLRAETTELKDIRSHWVHWRDEWQQKLLLNEIHFLKSVSELQSAFDGKLLKMDSDYRDSVRQQHDEFAREMDSAVDRVQSRLWADMERIRIEYERMIHHELRVARQKAFISGAVAAVPTPSGDFDYARFADRFRGPEHSIRERQGIYLQDFAGCTNVLDIGCGRGEFLELMRDGGIPARGIDADAESVAECRSKGLTADVGDVFQMLATEADGSFDGIMAAQVVEHIEPHQVPVLVKLCIAKLKPGGLLALETPNPECLAIYASHFFLDPTHKRPIPPMLLAFYYEEFGLGRIEIRRLSPAVESMPSLAELPEAFRDTFFGALDYAILGRKL